MTPRPTIKPTKTLHANTTTAALGFLPSLLDRIPCEYIICILFLAPAPRAPIWFHTLCTFLASQFSLATSLTCPESPGCGLASSFRCVSWHYTGPLLCYRDERWNIVVFVTTVPRWAIYAIFAAILLLIFICMICCCVKCCCKGKKKRKKKLDQKISMKGISGTTTAALVRDGSSMLVDAG